jgi:DNA-binding transcriptional LysR family regulator
MRFTLKQIAYFVATAETGSITLASERVNISQPSISSAITALEESYGIQLFIRHHAQGLSLTAEGQRFLREARALLLQAEEVESAAFTISSRIGGPLEIGCLSTLFPLVIPELLTQFKKRHEAVRLATLAGSQTELFEHMRSGRISLLLTYDMALTPEFDFIPLAPVPPYVYVGATHPFTRRRSVTLRELTDDSFLLLDLPLSRDYFLSLFRQAGVNPNITGRYQYIDVIRSLVARGEGYSIANAQPRNTATLDGRKLTYLALEDTLRPLVYGIALLKGLRRTPTAEAFIALCQDLLRDKPLPGTR